MRMSADTFTTFKSSIEALDTEDRRHAYREGNFPRSAGVKDLNKRYRWDLLWVANSRSENCLIGAAYSEGLNDAHIDTALRKAVPEL